MRMLELIATLTHFAILIQDTIHRPPRAQVFSFVNQCGIHFAWSLILKAITVQQLADFSFLCGKESTWGSQRFRYWAWIGCRSHSIETTLGNIQCLAGSQHTDRFSQLFGGLNQCASLSLLAECRFCQVEYQSDFQLGPHGFVGSDLSSIGQPGHERFY